MSKITINAVLSCLRLVLSLFAKCIRVLYAVMDLADDGCINASLPRPDWMVSVQSVISSLESLGSHISSVEDDVYKSSTINTSTNG